MSAVSTSEAALVAAATKYSDQLFTQAYFEFDAIKHAIVMEGIKGQKVLTELDIAKYIWKRASSSFRPTPNLVKFKPRTIDVVEADADFLIEPLKLAKSYLDHFRKLGQNNYDIPFEIQVLGGLMLRMGQQLNEAFWQGSKANSPNPDDPLHLLFDGIIETSKKLRAVNGAVPVQGGEYSETNIVPQISSMQARLGGAARQEGIVGFCNKKNLLLYIANMESLYPHSAPRLLFDKLGEPEAVQMRHYSGWLYSPSDYGSSELITLTAKNNIVFGTDQMSDVETPFKIMAQIKDFQFTKRAAFGLNVRCGDADYLVTNDLN
jgi:hypothetical protein